jgi:hypothetical protein
MGTSYRLAQLRRRCRNFRFNFYVHYIFTLLSGPAFVSFALRVVHSFISSRWKASPTPRIEGSLHGIDVQLHLFERLGHRMLLILAS